MDACKPLLEHPRSGEWEIWGSPENGEPRNGEGCIKGFTRETGEEKKEVEHPRNGERGIRGSPRNGEAN